MSTGVHIVHNNGE